VLDLACSWSNPVFLWITLLTSRPGSPRSRMDIGPEQIARKFGNTKKSL
jgi:hypothetical protein